MSARDRWAKTRKSSAGAQETTRTFLEARLEKVLPEKSERRLLDWRIVIRGHTETDPMRSIHNLHAIRW